MAGQAMLGLNEASDEVLFFPKEAALGCYTWVRHMNQVSSG
jgi:hypothetical protein